MGKAENSRALVAVEHILNQSRIRQDGWFNALTMLGVQGRDKRTGARILPHVIGQADAEALYQADDIAARIADRPPQEMMREGFKVVIPEDKKNIAENVMTHLEKFQVAQKVEQGLIWARLYGGAGLLLGLNDGMDPSEPVDLQRIRGIDYITVIDKYRLFPANIINYDVTSPNFGYPDYYRLYTMQTVLPMIHHSRIIRFEGVPVPWRLRAHFNYWGDTIYGRLWKIIRDFQASHDSLALTVQDFTQFIFKLKNLTALLAQKDKGDALLAKRLQLIGMTSSMLNAIVISDDEEAERKTTNVTGLADLIKQVNNRLVAATDMPHTVLLGESPSGLGADGKSELINWYDHIKSKQKNVLQPILMKVLEIFFSARDGATNGKVPDRFAIEFNPLWQIDEETASKVRLNQAQADNFYLQNQTLTPEEVADSRFGSGQYSTETQLDHEARNSIEEAIAKGRALNEGEPEDKTSLEDPANSRDPSTYLVAPAPKLKSQKTKVKKNR